jgi:hypothetical protein
MIKDDLSVSIDRHFVVNTLFGRAHIWTWNLNWRNTRRINSVYVANVFKQKIFETYFNTLKNIP